MNRRFSKALKRSSEIDGWIHHIVISAILDGQDELGVQLSTDEYNRVYHDGFKMIEKDVNKVLSDVERLATGYNKRGGGVMRKSRSDNYFPFLSREANAFWEMWVAVMYKEDPPALNDVPTFINEYGEDGYWFLGELQKDIMAVHPDFMGQVGSEDTVEEFDNLSDDEQDEWYKDADEIYQYVESALEMAERISGVGKRRSGRGLLRRRGSIRRRGRIMNRRNGRAPMRRRGR